MRKRQDEIVDECVERLLAGEPLEDVLRSQPGRAAELLPLLRAALSLRLAPHELADELTRSDAERGMLSALEHETERSRRFASICARWLQSRPRHALAGMAAAVLVVSAVGGGAVAGVRPPLLDSFFADSRESQTSSVTRTGAIVSLDRDLLGLETAEGIQRIARSTLTIVLLGEQEIPWDNLRVGQEVDVRGSVRDDGTVAADQVHIKPQPQRGPDRGAGAGNNNNPGSSPGRGPSDDGPGAAPQSPGNQGPKQDDRGGPGSGNNNRPSAGQGR